MHGQSDSSTSKSAYNSKHIAAVGCVLGTSIPAITSDLPQAKNAAVAAYFVNSRFWGADAVLVDTPITVEQARALANWVAARERI